MNKTILNIIYNKINNNKCIFDILNTLSEIYGNQYISENKITIVQYYNKIKQYKTQNNSMPNLEDIII